MTSERIRTITGARHLLESRTANADRLCHAMVEIAKPYDADIIELHAPLVASFLDHHDFLVRHEAVWYLGSWGHLPAYADHIVHASRTDSDLDNRAFATRSIGSILKRHKERKLVEVLLHTLHDDKKEMEIRRSAYSGLLYAWNRPNDFDFMIGDKSVANMDRDFINELQAWTRNEHEMPPVTPRRGIVASLIHAWRINHAPTSS